MKIPSWAPLELVDAFNDLEKEVIKERARATKAFDPRRMLEEGKLYVGKYFLGAEMQRQILSALITHQSMKSVWAALNRRAASFKPVNMFPYGRQTAAYNLYGACLTAEFRWLNLPRRTRTEARKLYGKIATHAGALADLLLQDSQNTALLSMNTLVPKHRFEAFRNGLLDDDHPNWGGFEHWLDILVYETLLEPLPAYLLTLEKRAKALAIQPPAVKQPKSKAAKANFFVELLSEYFTKAYGSPLHAHVSTIVSAIFNTEIDEDRVRALLRTRKKSPRRNLKVSG
jgi:hypothetical protein